MTRDVFTVDVDSLDPDQKAEKCSIYIPAIWMENESTGWYTTTAHNEITIRKREPPVKPTFVDAPEISYPGKRVKFNAVTIDPDEENVFYKFAWGDGDSSGWIGPAWMGVTMGEYHTYAAIDSYEVTVLARDDAWMVSEASDAHTISIENLTGIMASATISPGTIYWGSECRLTTWADDPGSDDAKFWIDWADGDPPFWTEDLYEEGSHQVFTHTFDGVVGPKHIGVRATDCITDTSAVKIKELKVLPLPSLITELDSDASSVTLEWITQTEQETLSSRSILYSLDPGLDLPSEQPVSIDSTRTTITSLESNRIYYFRVVDHYDCGDTIVVANSLIDWMMTAPLPPTAAFLAPPADTLGGTVEVLWLATDPDSGETPRLHIALDYSRDGGAWTGIGPDLDGVNDGSYLWNTLNYDDGQYLLRVTATDPTGRSGSALSDTLWVDNPDEPQVDVIEPQPGRHWSGTHEITWIATDADGDPLSITIQARPDDSGYWAELASDEPNDGTWTWHTAPYPDRSTFRIKVIAEDLGLLAGEGVSGTFCVDNTPPELPRFSGIVPALEAGVGETVELQWPPALDALSEPVSYRIYWGASEAAINYVSPVWEDNYTYCTLSGHPSGSWFFAIEAEDDADPPNVVTNLDPDCVYFTQLGGVPSDNSPSGLVSRSNGVVTGGGGIYHFNGSVVVGRQTWPPYTPDDLFINNATCTFSDTTGSSCLRVYGRLRTIGSTYQATAPGDWAGILFEDDSVDYDPGATGCLVDSCTIEHAVNGIKSRGSQQLITDSHISEHSHAGIDCCESSAIITLNNIFDNAYGDLLRQGGDSAHVHHRHHGERDLRQLDRRYALRGGEPAPRSR